MEVAADEFQVGQQPAIAGQQYQISVRAVGRLSETSQFENIILKTNNDAGSQVRPALERNPEVGRCARLYTDKVTRRHPYDREGDSLNMQGTAHEGRIAPEPTRP